MHITASDIKTLSCPTVLDAQIVIQKV